MEGTRPGGAAPAGGAGSGSGSGSFPSLFPPGLHGIYGECRRLYPEQPNPLQVTAILKYWLGGPDPLDYVSMYRNIGNPALNVPEHWHYVSFGLSDLYGDNRVHEFTGTDGPSGFGFELTFRLKRETGESAPPTWPAELMQGLARYVFQSGCSVTFGMIVKCNNDEHCLTPLQPVKRNNPANLENETLHISVT